MSKEQEALFQAHLKKAWIIYSILTVVLIVVLVLFVASDTEERFFFSIMPAAAAYVLRPTKKYMGGLVTKYTGVEAPAEQSARKEGIRTLLKGIETGDEASVAIVNEDRYIQHNPQTAEGGEGLAELFKRLAQTSPRVNVVRMFEDGDFVFAHTEYDFDTERVGFEVFRFEDELAVEHWDNIQPAKGPNGSGHSMVDGPTEASDHDSTESNREKVRDFIETVLVGGRPELLGKYIDTVRFVEHNPGFGDDMTALASARTRWLRS